MRNKPTYDWDWFISHEPFKKILTETCDLEIYIKIKKTPVIFNIYTNHKCYWIKFNYQKYKENFEEIKNRLLNTNICKHNEEIFEWIKNLTDEKKEVCFLITDGCIKNCTGSFKWDWCE